MFSGLTPVLQWTMAGIFAILLVATLIVFVLRRVKPERDYAELGLRVRSWWVMAAIFLVAMALSRTVSLVFLALVSFLALKEYLSLIPTRRADRRVLLWAYLAIPIQYLWVGAEWYGMFIIFIPVFAFLLLPTFIYVAIVRHYSLLDWGATLTGYAGLLLFIGFLVSFGLFISSMAGSQMVAAVVTLVLTDLRGERVALRVDKVVGQQQIYVKPVPELLSQVRALAGLTILGDGRPVFVLDQNQLA